MTAVAPLRMLGQAADQTSARPSRLCHRGVDRLLLLYAALWVVYVVTAFRMPWMPLNESEAPTNNATRQVFLTLGFLLAAKRLVITGTVGAAVSMHMGGLILGLLMLGSVCWSLDPTLTIKRSLVYLFGYLFLVSVTHACRWPLRFYMGTVLYVVGCVAWISVAAYYIFPRNCTELSFHPGLAGLSGHPNVFGPCLEMAWGLGLGYASASSRQRFCKYVMMAGILVALYMTDSVTAIVATAIATVVYVLMTVTSYRAAALLLCGVGGALLACAIGLSGMEAMFFDAIGRDISMSGRDTLWREVFREAIKSPSFGAGYGAFWSEGRGREIAVTWNPRQAHNAYLDVFVDIGVVGLLLVLSVVHWRVITIWQSFAGRRGTVQRNAVAAYVSMAIGLCCIGAFGESYLLKLDKFQFFVLFWGIIVFENRDGNHVVAECEATKRPMVRA